MLELDGDSTIARLSLDYHNNNNNNNNILI